VVAVLANAIRIAIRQSMGQPGDRRQP
jgi:hypothetical protein